MYRQVVHLIESNFIDISNKEFSRKIRIDWSSSINAFKFSGDQIEYKRELWDKAHKKFTSLKPKNEIINKINEDISILNAAANSDKQNSIQESAIANEKLRKDAKANMTQNKMPAINDGIKINLANLKFLKSMDSKQTAIIHKKIVRIS